MTKHDFMMAGQPFVSLVMDESEFAELMDVVRETGVLSEEQIETIAEAGHLPMVIRGSRTEPIFVKYDVRTRMLAAVVRGKGEELLGDKKVIQADEMEELVAAHWERMSEETQRAVMETAGEVAVVVLAGGDPTGVVSSFVHRFGASCAPRMRAHMVEQSCEALAQTAFMGRMQVPAKHFPGYLRDYVRQLLCGNYVALTQNDSN